MPIISINRNVDKNWESQQMELVLRLVCLASAAAHEFSCQGSVCWSLGLGLHFVRARSACEHGTAQLIRWTLLPQKQTSSNEFRVTAAKPVLSMVGSWANTGFCGLATFKKWVTWNPVHFDEIAVLLLYLRSVSSNQENAKEGQKTAGREF